MSTVAVRQTTEITLTLSPKEFELLRKLCYVTDDETANDLYAEFCGVTADCPLKPVLLDANGDGVSMSELEVRWEQAD